MTSKSAGKSVSKKALTKAATKAKPAKTWYKTDWDLSDLYSGINDPKIDQDLALFEKVSRDFAKKYAKDRSYLEDAAKLRKALEDWNDALETVGNCIPKLTFYFHLVKDLNTSDTAAAAKATLINDRMTKVSNDTVFFNISLSKISKENQAKFLKDERLAPYAYYLKKVFDEAKYKLTEAEEKISNLMIETSYTMWVDAQKKLAGQQVIRFKGKDLSLTQAYILRKELPQKDRYRLHDMITKTLKDISFMAEAEMNAVVNFKKTEDGLRGHKNAYESTVLSYENDLKTVDTLVDIVTRNFSFSQEYYKIKAKVMGLKKMRSPDVAVALSQKKKKIPLEQGIKIISDAFEKVDPMFRDFFHEMLSKGRIDFYPKKGKRGGAFMAPCSRNVPVYIFMNYDDTMDSVSTLAHEMGHAIHSKMSFESHPALNNNYTISVAEVASTFFEQVVFNEIFKTLDEKEQAIALLNDIEDNVGTIFRQIQFFNFEKELHEAIRAKGSISAADMAALHLKHTRLSNGPAVESVENDGYLFSYVPHFRYYFYVYSYAYGQLISRAMYAKYKADPSFIEQVKKFLSAGCSMSPYDIFKSIGIDTSRPEFFEEGIKSLREDLAKAVKLAKKVKLI